MKKKKATTNQEHTLPSKHSVVTQVTKMHKQVPTAKTKTRDTIKM